MSRFKTGMACSTPGFNPCHGHPCPCTLPAFKQAIDVAQERWVHYRTFRQRQLQDNRGSSETCSPTIAVPAGCATRCHWSLGLTSRQQLFNNGCYLQQSGRCLHAATIYPRSRSRFHERGAVAHRLSSPLLLPTTYNFEAGPLSSYYSSLAARKRSRISRFVVEERRRL